MKLKRLTLSILIATGAVTLGACSSSSNTNETPNTEGPDQTKGAVYNGTALDGLLVGANVCIDTNENMICDTGETSTTTDSDGKYTFSNLTASDGGKQITVYASASTTGNETGKPLYLISKLPATIENDTTISGVTSPFTMLMDGTGLTAEQLRAALGLPENAKVSGVYIDDPATKNFAVSLAKVIANQIDSYRSASVTPKDILLGANGVLEQIKEKLSNTTLPRGTKLETFLSDIKPQLSLNFVADASVNISLKDTYDNALQQVNIIAKAYDATTNTELTSDDGFKQLVVQTDSQGRAQLNLPKYSNHTAINLHLSISKDGFAPLEKVIKGIKTGTQLPATFTMSPIEVITTPINTDTLSLGEATAASLTTGEPAITFALIKLSNGKETILTGEAAAQAMADGTGQVQVGVQIPTSRIDTTKVKAITAGIKGFNPNKQTEAQSFPGTFEGTGDPASFATAGITTDIGEASAAANGETYRLISSAFANISLEDQNGNEIALTNVAAGAAGESNPIIYLKVPEESYPNIKVDENDNTADGIQVPIYAYYTGWTLVGLGTLVEADGQGGYQDLTSDESYTLDPLSASRSVYAEIEITEGNSWIQWLNLDHPIKGGSLVDINFDGTLVYDGDDQEPFEGSGYIELPDGGQEWVYVSNGQFEYDTLLDSSKADQTKLHLYNPRINDYEEFSFSQVDSTHYSVNATLQNPYLCRVDGNVTNVSGQPKAWQWLYLYDDNYLFYQSFYTNENGEFSTAVPCDRNLNLQTGSGTTLTTNVNDSVETNEQSDDGSQVILAPIQLPNLKPYVWAYSDNRITIPENGSADFTITAYGWDDDSTDMSFTFTCPGSNTLPPLTEGEATSASISKQSSHTCSVSAAELGGLDQKTLNWQVTVTDTDGGTHTTSGSIQVELENINHAPKIWGITRSDAEGNIRYVSCYRSSTNDNLQCYDRARAGNYTYSINATDPDGDSLTYSVNSSSLSENIYTTSLSDDESNTITVTDQPPTDSGLESKSTQALLNIDYVENQPPETYVYLSDYSVQPGQAEDITIYAYAWDDFTPEANLTYQLTVTDENGNNIEVPSDQNYRGQWALPVNTLANGVYTVTLTVTDSEGASGTDSTTFSVENSAIPELYNLEVSPTEVDVVEAESGTVNSGNLTVNFSAWDDDFGTLSATVSLIDAEDNIVASQVVSSTKIDYWNEVLLDYSGLSIGDYTVKVTLQDADNDPVAQTTEFKIIHTDEPEIALSLTPDSATVDEEGNVTPSSISVSYAITDDHPETLTNLSLKLVDSNDNIIGSPQTLSSKEGTANIDISGLAEGVYEVVISAQDGDHDPVSQSATLTISEQQTQAGNTTVIVR